jgi:hypothetical protein
MGFGALNQATTVVMINVLGGQWQTSLSFIMQATTANHRPNARLHFSILLPHLVHQLLAIPHLNAVHPSQLSALMPTCKLRMAPVSPGAEGVARIESSGLAKIVVLRFHALAIRHPAHDHRGMSALDTVAEYFHRPDRAVG